MTFKTLLVSLNDISRNQAILEAGVGLARDFDAHITGLYIIPAVEVYASGFESMPVVFEGRRDHFTSQDTSVRSAFEAAISKENVRGDFRLIDSSLPDISGATIEHGCTADLVILSQADSTDRSMVDEDLVERVSISTGRPTLVIPRKGANALSPDLVIIGWNATRESARAAFDSIPLLRRSKEVRVVWVNPQLEFDGARVLPGSELAETLSRHGINAVAEALPSGEDTGEALLTRVSDTGAGLLVMGAYGHSRLRDFILGGATRSVLKQMNCPVFFSH
jgi:nucleotide-binding universal stress UspA family protein